MRRPSRYQNAVKYLSGLLLLALLFGKARGEKSEMNEYSEPPLEILIKIDGNVHRLRSGEESQIRIGERDVSIAVDASDYRTLRVSDVSFRYPRHMAFEVDRDNAPVEVWTLDGNATVIMLLRYPKSFGDITEASVAGVEQEFGKKNVKRSSVTMELAGAKRRGIHVDARAFQTTRVSHDYFFLRGKSYNYLLAIQESRTQGEERTNETQHVVRLLQESLTLTTDD